MKTPIYNRKWFRIGGLILIIGVLSGVLSHYKVISVEREYPDLAKSEREKFLEKVNLPEKAQETPEEMTEEEKDKRWNAEWIHGLYGKYIYLGYFLAGLGIILMFASIYEPQMPTIEDLDDDEESPPK